MPKQRRKYKEYLWNNQKTVPKSTKYFKLRQDSVANGENTVRPEELNNVNNENILPPSNAGESSFEFSNNHQDYHLEGDDNDSEEEITSNKYDYVNANDNDFLPDLVEALSSSEITKNDLAIAYLSAFFNGSTSQDSLSDYIKLSNFTSHIKLPTTFGGLSNLVIGKKQQLNSNKSWFCNTCIKEIKSLDSRLQRSCSTCKSRFLF